MSKQNVKVCLIDGSYAYRNKVIKQIKQILGDFDLTIFEEIDSLEFIKNEIRSISFLDKKKLYHISNWPKHKGTKATMMKHFKALLENVPDHSVVILNDMPRVSDAFVKFIAELPHGKVFQDAAYISDTEAVSRLIKQFEEIDKTIDRSLADDVVKSLGFVDKQGVSVDKLHLVFKKINDYIGTRKVVKEEDIFALCRDSNNYMVWTMINKLDNKSYCEALMLLNQSILLESDAKKAIDSASYFLYWRYKLILFVKESFVQGLDENEILKRVRNLHKMKRADSFFHIKMSIEKTKDDKPRQLYSEGMIRTTIQGSYGKRPAVLCYSRKELYLIVEALAEVFKKTRAGCSVAEALTALDTVFMLICGVVKAEPLKKLRRLNDVRFS